MHGWADACNSGCVPQSTTHTSYISYDSVWNVGITDKCRSFLVQDGTCIRTLHAVETPGGHPTMVTVSGAWGDESRRAYCKIVQDLTECVLNHCRCLYENSTDSKVKNAAGDSDCTVIRLFVSMIHRQSMPGLSYQDCPISVSCNCGSMPWWTWLIVIPGGLAVIGLIVGTCYSCCVLRKKTNKIMDMVKKQSDVLETKIAEQIRRNVEKMLKQ